MSPIRRQFCPSSREPTEIQMLPADADPLHPASIDDCGNPAEGAHGRYRFAITKTMRFLFGAGCRSSPYGRVLKAHDGRHDNSWNQHPKLDACVRWCRRHLDGCHSARPIRIAACLISHEKRSVKPCRSLGISYLANGSNRRDTCLSQFLTLGCYWPLGL